MLGAPYKTKAALKSSLGQPLRVIETSLFGIEYSDNGQFTVVGPDPYSNRRWYATVTMADGLIKRVT